MTHSVRSKFDKIKSSRDIRVKHVTLRLCYLLFLFFSKWPHELTTTLRASWRGHWQRRLCWSCL